MFHANPQAHAFNASLQDRAINHAKALLEILDCVRTKGRGGPGQSPCFRCGAEMQRGRLILRKIIGTRHLDVCTHCSNKLARMMRADLEKGLPELTEAEYAAPDIGRKYDEAWAAMAEKAEDLSLASELRIAEWLAAGIMKYPKPLGVLPQNQ